MRPEGRGGGSGGHAEGSEGWHEAPEGEDGRSNGVGGERGALEGTSGSEVQGLGVHETQTMGSSGGDRGETWGS